MKLWQVAACTVLYWVGFGIWIGHDIYWQNHPRFHRGQCIKDTYFREDWEHPGNIWKIRGIGLHNYRIRSYTDGKLEDTDSTMGYSSQSSYRAVKCH